MSRPLTPARWSRAVVLGVGSVGLAAASHVLGGGHAEPVFMGLLVIAAVLAARTWLSKERGLLAITAAVVIVQGAAHLGLSVGHPHPMSAAMVLTHAGAAVLLGVFLRLGEARVYAAARRRLLWLLVAMRLLAAGLPPRLAVTPAVVPAGAPLTSVWIPAPDHRRGPPVARNNAR